MEKPAAFEVYATELGRWEADRLFLAADAMRRLKTHDGWRWLETLLRERKDREITRLVHGPVLEQAHYAALASLVSGMESSLLAVDAVLYAAEVRERQEQQAAERRQEA